MPRTYRKRLKHNALLSSLCFCFTGWTFGATDTRLVTKDQVLLAASFYPVLEKFSTKRAAAVLLPMMGQDSDTWRDFAEKAARRGIACLAVDPRGHGRSQNPFSIPLEQWGPREWESARFDVAAAVAFLEKNGYSRKEIAVAGASIGASLALLYAVHDQELAAVALLSPGDNPGRIATADKIARYGRRPILIASSLDDPQFHEIAQRLAKAAKGPKTILTFTEAGHGTEMFGREDDPGALTRALIRWIADTVGKKSPRGRSSATNNYP